jgi:hypothetical protein
MPIHACDNHSAQAYFRKFYARNGNVAINPFEGKSCRIIKVNGFHEQILDSSLAINLFSYPSLPVRNTASM